MDCPSAKTRERAYVLIENAKKIGLAVGRPRYSEGHDYIAFWLTDMVDYMVIYCMPLGYFAELYTDRDGVLDTTYLGVKNIRHFLQKLNKLAYESADSLLDDLKSHLGDEDLMEFFKDDDDN